MLDYFNKSYSVQANGCWLWLGAESYGYGLYLIDGNRIYAHRLAAHLYLELDLSDNTKLVLHKCDNRGCVNPEHLYIGNYHDNIKDRATRQPGSWKNGNTVKTHCKNGHPFNRKLPSGVRACTTCNTNYKREYRKN